MNILLIDDDPMVHAVIRKIMAMNGFELVSAQNVQQGIDKLKTHDISLVISDVMMTGIDGLSFLSILKKDGQFQSVPVIIITSNLDPVLSSQALKQGAAGFLTKPVSEQDLVNLVKTFASLKGESTGITITDDFLNRKIQKITSTLTHDVLSNNTKTSTINFVNFLNELFDFSSIAFFKAVEDDKYEITVEGGMLNFPEEFRQFSVNDTPNTTRVFQNKTPVFSNDVLRHPDAILNSWAQYFSLVSEVIVPFYRYERKFFSQSNSSMIKTPDIVGLFWGFRNSVISSKECELLIKIFNQANPVLFDLNRHILTGEF